TVQKLWLLIAITRPTRKVAMSMRRGSQVNATQSKSGLGGWRRCESSMPNRAASAARDQNQAEPPNTIRASWKLIAAHTRLPSRKASMSRVCGGRVSPIPPISSTATAARAVRTIDPQERRAPCPSLATACLLTRDFQPRLPQRRSQRIRIHCERRKYPRHAFALLDLRDHTSAEVTPARLRQRCDDKSAAIGSNGDMSIRAARGL